MFFFLMIIRFWSQSARRHNLIAHFFAVMPDNLNSGIYGIHFISRAKV